MKKTHTHHTKKKSEKNHSSKAKLRKLSSLDDTKTKLHTRTKAITSRKRERKLELAASKLPNKKIYDKEEIIQNIALNHHNIYKKNIKLISNKVQKLTDEELTKYRQQQLELPTLIHHMLKESV